MMLLTLPPKQTCRCMTFRPSLTRCFASKPTYQRISCHGLAYVLISYGELASHREQNVFLQQAADSCTIVKRYAATEEACWLADHELEVLSLLPARSPHFVQLLGAYSRPCGGRWLELELVPTKSQHFLAATLSEMQQYMRSLFEVRAGSHAVANCFNFN